MKTQEKKTIKENMTTKEELVNVIKSLTKIKVTIFTDNISNGLHKIEYNNF